MVIGSSGRGGPPPPITSSTSTKHPRRRDPSLFGRSTNRERGNALKRGDRPARGGPEVMNGRVQSGQRVGRGVSNMASRARRDSTVNSLPPEPTDLTWEEMVKTEPRLGKLLKQV